MRRLLICSVMFVATCIGLRVYVAYTESELDSRHVVLRFERESSFSCVICDVDVFINKVKIGSVSNGKTKKFRFTPSASGVNTISATLVAATGPNIETNTVSFEASEGAEVYARYEVDPWVIKWQVETKLEVAIVKEGPSLVNPRPSDGSSPDDDNVLESATSAANVPWNAIGAIAGVLSMMVAIVGLFRRSE